jgi:SAM-dependent methyltransferase
LESADRPLKTPPPCPITGEPGAELIQTVRAGFLARLWEIEFKADARPSFKGVEEFELWRSRTGLMYFAPALEGDEGFYRAFYGFLGPKLFSPKASLREEFRLAATYIGAGSRVLDVGCGHGGFRLAVPHAEYLGLDPFFAGDGVDWARCESLSDHLASYNCAYDAVCAFEVLEHVEQPARMFGQMVQAVKPGGLVIAGVPHAPSAATRIPNFLINAPPHHLSWWSEKALETLAMREELSVEAIHVIGWSDLESIIYWIERCSFLRCKDAYFKHAWMWHLSALTGFALGSLLNKVMGPPKRARDEGSGLLLVARKPR